MERLEDIHEDYDFPNAVDLACGTGHVRRALSGGRGGVRSLLELDSSEVLLAASAAEEAAASGGAAPSEAHDVDGDDDFPPLEVTRRVVDHELPTLERESADLVISSMALHWVNDLPRTLAAARRVLRPNGLFLGAFLGGETLAEMRSAFVVCAPPRERSSLRHRAHDPRRVARGPRVAPPLTPRLPRSLAPPPTPRPPPPPPSPCWLDSRCRRSLTSTHSPVANPTRTHCARTHCARTHRTPAHPACAACRSRAPRRRGAAHVAALLGERRRRPYAVCGLCAADGGHRGAHCALPRRVDPLASPARYGRVACDAPARSRRP